MNLKGDICIFGASITYGALDVEFGGWVNRLRLYLDKKGYDGEVYNLGISGENSSALLKRFNNEVHARKTKKIIFSTGTNDSIYLKREKRNFVPEKQFEKNIRKLLAQAKGITKTIVFVGLIPVDEPKLNPIPWYKNGVYKNKNVKEYNDAVKKICKERKIQFIDLFDYFDKIKNYKKLLSTDGLHPNSSGHKLMFEKIKKVIKL